MSNLIKSDIQPFEMHPNIYFVGSSRVSVHIIRTEVGLVMIDTGYPDMYQQILNSMSELDLNPKDIYAIFHSHGHIDHFGCTDQFKKISGAKTYISRIDNDIVNGKLNLSWADELGYQKYPFFDCDVLIDDGDIFTFGSTSIRCVLTPGHTDGVLSFFITVKENEQSCVAAMHGGAGFNTLNTEFLKKYNLSFDCIQKFLESLHKLACETPDIVLGNHPGQNNTKGKLEQVLSGQSIIDRTEWSRLLEDIEQNLKTFLEKNKS